MSLIRSILTPPRMRATPGSYSFDDYLGWLSSAGYPLLNQTWSTNRETIEGDFAGLVRGAYQSNGVVFACLMTRFMLFAEARFQFQQLRGGRPGDLFGTPALQILERPEPGMTTGDLLSLALLDADLSGDWFGVRRPGRIKRLRPDWTTIIVGSPNVGIDFPAWDPDAEIIGYGYSPNGVYGSGETWAFGRDEVAHFAPIREPLLKYRGMPLPTAVLREIRADSAATTHKAKFFELAATPNMVVKFPPTTTKAKAQEMIDVFEEKHGGVDNAYRTMYLLGGAEAQVVGKDLQQLDFKATQGAGETRIAAAMNVHPTIVGLSEGLQGSSLNAGNFTATRRLQADKMLRPNWRNMAGSLETIVPPLPGSRLWVDDRDVPFLREDVKDAAEVLSIGAAAMRTLGDGGWEHDAVVDAVTSGDLRRLSGHHTGGVPVQLQFGTGTPPAAFAARSDFWPVSGDWVSAQVASGDHFAPDHPLVAAFPSLFEPVADAEPWAIRSAPPRPLALPPLVTVTDPVIATLPVGWDDDLRVAIRLLGERSDHGAAVVYPPSAPSVTFAEGAFQFVMPGTTIAEGAIQVTTPDVTVPVTVEPATVTFAEGAIRVDVTTPDVSIPITVEPTPITVENAVTVEPTPISVENAITVEPTPITVENSVSVEPTPVSITNELPEPRSITKRVVRNAANQITEIVEEAD